MNKFYLIIKDRQITVFCISALAAGFLNGLLGSGGGIIIMFTLSALYSGSGKENNIRDIFATTVACILPLSIVSSIGYFIKLNIDFSEVAPIFIAAPAGGIIGAYITDKIDTSLLKNIFSVIVIIAGVNMLLH